MILGDHPGVAWRELLDGVGITQAQLAREVDASPKHVNQIVQGAALPSAQLVIGMARVVAASRPDSDSGHDPDGRRLARLMWGLQSRYVFDVAMSRSREEAGSIS